KARNAGTDPMISETITPPRRTRTRIAAPKVDRRKALSAIVKRRSALARPGSLTLIAVAVSKAASAIRLPARFLDATHEMKSAAPWRRPDCKLDRAAFRAAPKIISVP